MALEEDLALRRRRCLWCRRGILRAGGRGEREEECELKGVRQGVLRRFVAVRGEKQILRSAQDDKFKKSSE